MTSALYIATASTPGAVYARGPILAASCSAQDVLAAVAKAVDGDTVAVPAGTCTWTSQVLIQDKSIILKGAGIDQTVIIDNAPAGYSPLQISLTQDKPFRVTGFTFDGAQARALNHSNGQIVILGVSKTWRVDHVRIKNNTYRGIQISGSGGATYGVIDHCMFEVPEGKKYPAQSISIKGDNRGPTMPGDSSWSTPLTLGTANAVYIEDCTFSYTGLGDGALDAYTGARYVFRNNNVNGTTIGHHGFDSSGTRSVHSFEIYNNTFNNTDTTLFTTMFFRGGTGVVFNNTVTNNYGSFILARNYRSISDKEGYATNPSNSSTTVIDDTTDFSAVSVGSQLWNVTDASYCKITSVTNPNTLVCDGLTGGTTNTFHKGDQYAISWLLLGKIGLCMGTGSLDGNQTGQQGYPCNDQIGRTTNQALAPLYQWGNNFRGNTSPIIQINAETRMKLHILSGRDYYDNKPMPGYVPYTYPHPLTSK
jgi:hypothetical protein